MDSYEGDKEAEVCDMVLCLYEWIVHIVILFYFVANFLRRFWLKIFQRWSCKILS